MQLVADESVERQIVELLLQEGHDVTYIAESAPTSSDDLVLAKANEANAVLMTSDKDFGELVFRQKLVHRGVVLSRLAGLSNETKARIVARVLQERSDELENAFGVISPGAVRIRPRR